MTASGRRTAKTVLLLAALWLAQATNVADAFTLDTTPTAATNVTGLWWNPNESGWGTAITQEGNIAFVAVFTYDGGRNPIWYVAPACSVSGDGCTGDLYRATGGAALASPWSGSVNAIKVGTIAFAFTDDSNGVARFTIDGAAGSKIITRQLFGQQPSVQNNNLTKTQMLIGGIWTFSYSIGAVGFTDAYAFTSISGPDASGSYFADGQGQQGEGPVAGTYDATSGTWDVLDPGIIIDRFFRFTFNDNNDVSGCYYQIDPPGSSNFSNCYSMFGTRSPPKALLQGRDMGSIASEQLQVEASRSDAGRGYIEPGVVESYIRLRAKVR